MIVLHPKIDSKQLQKYFAQDSIAKTQIKFLNQKTILASNIN